MTWEVPDTLGLALPCSVPTALMLLMTSTLKRTSGLVHIRTQYERCPVLRLLTPFHLCGVG